MEDIVDIINSIDSDLPNVNPTQIYNEGWMTRLLINHSIKEKIKFNGVDFGDVSKWTSEALISSPFIKTKQNREGYTHPDIVFGDFSVDYKISGQIMVERDAKIFGVIEAKMGSQLSTGTSNFKNYNQASRILTCISSVTYDKDCQIFFIVVAPKAKQTKIKEQIQYKVLISEIENRFSDYDENFKLTHKMDQLLNKAKECAILAWTYEDWINAIINPDSKTLLNNFYKKTIRWNRIKNHF